MECPTPCICGNVVALHDMFPICSTLPDGGNLVCEECLCEWCEGDGCEHCDNRGYECMTAKTAANKIELECDDLDYSAIQRAIAMRQKFAIMPDNGSNVAGAVLAEICRGRMEFLEMRQQ